MCNAYLIDAKKLRRVMQYRNETIYSLSKKSSIDCRITRRLVKGETKYPRLSTLGSLAIALQVPWRMLVKED